MEVFKREVAKRLQADLQAVLKGPDTSRAELKKVLAARLAELMPDPDVQVTVDEDASDAASGKIVVNVKGTFPDSLIEAWKEAGIEVRVGTQPE